jgi:hypothetical protein
MPAICDELEKLKKGGTASDTTFGKIAKILFDNREARRVALNAVGAKIGYAEASPWSATHSQEMIRAGGRGKPPTPDEEAAYRAWKAVVEPRFTIRDLIVPEGKTEGEALESAWRGIFNSFVSGTHLRMEGDNTADVTGGSSYFQGTYNVARSVSHERVMIKADTKPDAIDRAVAKVRRDIGDRLSMFYSSTADQFVISPGVRERVSTQKYLGTSPVTRALCSSRCGRWRQCTTLWCAISPRAYRPRMQ